MKRSRAENFVIVTVTAVWGLAVLLSRATEQPVEPALHYIMGSLIAAVFGIKLWRNGNGR
jgi:hypothetical protein